MKASKTTILTGIKPTGHPHVGNYAGMIKPALQLIEGNKGGRNHLFIANYHALNTMDRANELRQYTYEIAACFLALGLDLETTSFYRQSDVPEIFELTAVLASVTPKGLMNRAHAYKAKVEENLSKSNADRDDGVNMGLYTYPILMAADILLFDADVVPVGKDQVQHVEFARDIAGYFNRKFDTQFFKQPAHRVQADLEALPGVDGRKMSKSYGNTIPLFGDMSTARKLIKRIVTDSKPPAEPKDASSLSLYQIYRALADEDEAEDLKRRFEAGGLGYGEAKTILADKFEVLFEKPAKRYKDYLSDKGELERIMVTASRRARGQARCKIEAMRTLIGA
mgnify:CR=1 FL=1